MCRILKATGDDDSIPSKKKNGQGPGAPGAEAVWFDRDKVIPRARRAASDKVIEMQTKLEEAKAEGEEAVVLTSKLATVEREELADEVLIVKGRIEACTKVLGDPAALNEYIRSFDQGLGAPASKLGTAPPCRFYASLTTIFFLKTIVDQYSTVPNKEAMEELKKQMLVSVKPIANLIGSTNAQTSELVKLFAKATEAAKKRKTMDTTPDTRRRRAGDVAPGKVLEVCPNHGIEIPAISSLEALLDKKDGKHWTTPVIITKSVVTGMDDLIAELAPEIKSLDLSLTELVKKCNAPQRRGKALPAEKLKMVSDSLGACYPWDTIATDGCDEKLKEVLGAQLWAMSSNSVWSQPEIAHLAAVRLQCQGSRAVALTQEDSMISFMKARAPGSMPVLAASWQYFRTMSDDLFKAYAAAQGKDNSFYGTVNVGDALFTPPGFIIADRGNGPNSVGVKRGLLAVGHLDMLQKIYSEIESKSQQTRGTGPLLKAALERVKAANASAAPAV